MERRVCRSRQVEGEGKDSCTPFVDLVRSALRVSVGGLFPRVPISVAVSSGLIQRYFQETSRGRFSPAGPSFSDRPTNPK